jgi:hypothetical protein
MFPADGGGINESEAVALLLIAGTDIGGDARAREAVDCLAQSIVIASRGSTVGENQQILACDPDTLAHSLFSFQLLHDLGDAIAQDVLFVDRREAPGTRDDLNPVAVMLVCEYPSNCPLSYLCNVFLAQDTRR